MAAIVSNTARVTYPPEQQPAQWKDLIAEFSSYGEVARLDASLSAILGSILVTFYDSRVTARLLMERPGQTELVPGLPHDFRAVKVNMTTLAEKMGTNFGSYGEVANCSVVCGDVVVEFFDIRAAQRLLAAVGTSGAPWTCLSQETPVQLPPPSLQDALTPTMQDPSSLSAPSSLLINSLRALVAVEQAAQSNMAALAKALEEATPQASSQSASTDEEKVEREPSSSESVQSPKPGRAKVTNKEFSKYDINPEQIQSGEDLRTTVMVRNLSGSRAREDFLKLLEVIGLFDRYTFFYMPYKEHRNVLAGFAFVNFVGPEDVQILYAALQNGSWETVHSNPNGKVPAMSFARFQGHDELVKHFSASAVLHEQDPDRRPIFRPDAGKRPEDARPKKGRESDFIELAKELPAFVPFPQQPAHLMNKNWLSEALSQGTSQIEANHEDPINGWSAGA